MRGARFLWLILVLGALLSVTGSVLSQTQECWQLVNVDTRFRRFDFETSQYLSLSADSVSHHIATDDALQWVIFDDPTYSVGRANAQVRWQPPPATYCENDTVAFGVQMDNYAPGTSTTEIAGAIWGPAMPYAGHFECTHVLPDENVSLPNNQSSVENQCSAVINSGEATANAFPTWAMELHVGSYFAMADYHYAPAIGQTVTQPTAPTAPTVQVQTELPMVVRVGTTLKPPIFMVQPPSGPLTGFEAELMLAISDRADFIFGWVVLDYDDLFDMLLSGDVDVVIDTLSMTPARQEIVNFTVPYYNDAIYIMALAENTAIRSRDDVMDGNVGVLAMSGAEYLLRHGDYDVTSATFDTLPDLLRALQTGVIDAALVEDYYIRVMAEQYPNASIRYLPQPFISNPMAIGVGKNQPALLEALNRGLEMTFLDGTYAAIYTRWFGVPPLVASGVGIESPTPQTVARPVTLTAAMFEDVAASMPAPVDPDQIVMFTTGQANALPLSLSYQFEPMEIAPDVIVDTTARYDVTSAGLQPRLEWVIRNEGDGTQQVEYIADLPKSFAESARMIQFSPAPAEILNDDPLIKWLVAVDRSTQVLIQAQSAQMVALGAAVNGGDAASISALSNSVVNLLIDIDTRRQLNRCSLALSSSQPNPDYAALCTLIVMSTYPDNFFPTDCDMAFDDDQNSRFMSAYRRACRGIVENGYDQGQVCEGLDSSEMVEACRTTIRYSVYGACARRPAANSDQCLYDSAVQSGEDEPCDSITNVDLATTCNAYVTQDPNYCQVIFNETALEACCGMFSYDTTLYAHCMGDAMPTATTTPTATPDAAIVEGETLTLDEVLGSGNDGDNSSVPGSSGDIDTFVDGVWVFEGGTLTVDLRHSDTPGTLVVTNSYDGDVAILNQIAPGVYRAPQVGGVMTFAFESPTRVAYTWDADDDDDIQGTVYLVLLEAFE